MEAEKFIGKMQEEWMTLGSKAGRVLSHKDLYACPGEESSESLARTFQEALEQPKGEAGAEADGEAGEAAERARQKGVEARQRRQSSRR